ncbi:branched-chain amino acid transaminase [Arcobacter caeni]|uniref:Branched-chain-amino-acid aminotransferase n=1 Tax=Arcobacter caeni TaxID=1912877 RepID=A0A363D410_9BACT|nr:branched-chain amino acid transaminase [Arcobacter caeni]PUE66039.1 branched chain amino acid aminotransferase [Arcobacter caeni]
MQTAKYIWMDGKLLKWEDANIHITTHTLHYGNGVFEGIRAYKTKNGLAIFRLKKHIKRLLDSAKIVMIDSPYSYKEIKDAIVTLIKKNEFKNNIYIRPIIYYADGNLGILPSECKVRFSIIAWEWSSLIDKDGLKTGIKAKISSFRRNSINSTMSKAKAVSNYLNSQMSKKEALDCGYDVALLLDDNGFIAEASGECFFMVRNKTLITPPNDNSLESITQDTVIKLAKNMGIKVRRRNITRDEVYICDEAFSTGTAAEITPFYEIDNRVINNSQTGKITKKIQKAYFNLIYGNTLKYNKYLTYIL